MEMKYNLESKQEDDIELPPLEMSELYQKIYNNNSNNVYDNCIYICTDEV